VASGLSRRAALTLVTVFVLNASTTMVVPFLAIYLQRRQHLPPAVIGTVLTAYLLSVRLLPALTGSLSDRLGTKAAVVAGCLLRAAGLFAFPSLDTWQLMVVGAAVIGLGGAFAEPALRAVLANEPDRARASAFAIRNQVLNGSFVIGAGIGGALATVNLVVPFYVSATAIGLLVALTIAYLPGRVPQPAGLLTHYRTALGTGRFVLFWLVMIPFWVLYTQLNVAFPLYAFQLTGDESRVGLLFVVSGVFGVLFMWPTARLYGSWPALRGVLAGLGCLVLSFALVPVVQTYQWFITCILLFTVAETLVLVGSDLFIARFTSKRTVATFYGLYTTAWAVGGTIGNYLGAWFTSTHGQPSDWLAFAAIGTAAFAGVGLLLLLGEVRPGAASEARKP
jgi:MFS family permease